MVENGTKPFSTLQWLYETLLMKTKRDFQFLGLNPLFLLQVPHFRVQPLGALIGALALNRSLISFGVK